MRGVELQVPFEFNGYKELRGSCAQILCEPNIGSMRYIMTLEQDIGMI